MNECEREKLLSEIMCAIRKMDAAALYKTAAFLAEMETAGNGGRVLWDEEGGEQSE